MSTRKKVTCDYKVYSETGEKVDKDRDTKMATPEKLKIMATNIKCDIEDFYESYLLDEIWDEVELNIYIGRLEELKKEHRRIHAQLKEIDEKNFGKSYPSYEAQKQKLSEVFKTVNERISTIRKTKNGKIESDNQAKADLERAKIEFGNEKLKQDKEKANLEMEKLKQDKEKANLEMEKLKFEVEEQKVKANQLMATREKLRCVFRIFSEKVMNEIAETSWERILEEDEATLFLIKLESRLETLDRIYSDLSGTFFGETEEFDGRRNEILLSLEGGINSGKTRIKDLKANAILRQTGKVLADEKARASQVMKCANELYIEIKTRYDTLLGKCQIDPKKLGDFEVLSVKKREDNFNLELRELIDKVTAYAQFVSPCREEAEDACLEIGKMRDICIERVSELFSTVDNVITSNDISEKKLKNAAVLNIDLKKFKGYNSDVDIYTFKEEFKKLVEPNFQRTLLPDYLKKNYLSGSAYTLVAKLEKIEDIWEKLISVFGNTQLLLQNKLCSLEKFSNLEKLRDDEKIVFVISELLNVMTDLAKLAATYKLEGNLYYGGGLQKILRLIGEYRERKFLKMIARDNLNDQDKWGKLEIFLENERTEREMFMINEKTKKSLDMNVKHKEDKTRDSAFRKHKDPPTSNQDNSSGKSGFLSQSGDEKSQKLNGLKCYICGKSGHVASVDKNGEPQIEYFVCKRFVEMNPFDRMKILYEKGLCGMCLKPGIKRGSEHDCNKKYICKNTYKRGAKVKNCLNHVLVCGFHAKGKENIESFERYKNDFILGKSEKFETFSKEVSISLHADSVSLGQGNKVSSSDTEKSEENAIFMFQTIEIQNVKFNIFYDSGCGDLVVSKSAIDKLLKLDRARQVAKGPLILCGVGDVKSECKHGAYSITLPLENGGEATMSGICLDRITGEFPKYPLKNVEAEFRSIFGNSVELPKLPDQVGGEVEIMMGIQYLKLFPEKVASTESGLTIYRSVFKNSDGSNGIIAGPHAEFTKADRLAQFCEKSAYLNPTVRGYNESFVLRNSVPLLGEKSEIYHYSDATCRDEGFMRNKIHVKKRAPKALKIFEEIEQAGTEIHYRCIDCRGCVECKKGSAIEEISIQEEAEQQIINKSVSVDFDKRVSTAKLPFLSDPDVRLSPNKNIARKIYNVQVGKLAKMPADRQAVLESENKLQALGYVDYLDDLDEAVKKSILESKLLHFIPWRVVWNEKSLSTLVRLVFDASHCTGSGPSLNDLLAKGANGMNNLIQILIRWTTMLYAFHTDVAKMYNAVQLDPSYWRYQLYLWERNLNPQLDPVIKVIKTLIYGVRSSGNQAECALRKIAINMSGKYPAASKIIEKDVYVDDCISGAHTRGEIESVTEDIKVGLQTGGFTLKGFTFSGREPEEKLSADGASIHVGGLKWYPKADMISLSIDELNFSKKIRGRKDEKARGVIPDKVTKKDCVGRLAECFDPLGRVAPLIAAMKQDVSQLHACGLNWDDAIPDNLRKVWESNFEMMNEIRDIKYNRAIVPIDAINLDIETIGTGDASQKMVCAAIYARFQKKDGSFSCQLIFARTKVVAEGVSTPRAELMAALLNASTGHVVGKALGDRHKRTLKLTDSQVTLHWICSKRTVLKTWVRNRVIEINRLCDSSLWRYVDGANMVADIGTRKGVKVSEVMEDSIWIKGFSWMSKATKDFPVFTVEQIKLDNVELQNLRKEQLDIDIGVNSPTTHYTKNWPALVTKRVSAKVKSRYDFSKYLIDPNRFRFRTVVRILSLVLTFIKKVVKKNIKLQKIQRNKIFTHSYPGEVPKMWRPVGDKYVLTTGKIQNMWSSGNIGGKVIEVSDDMLKSAMYYFAWKATLELKNFVDVRKYVHITKEIDNVLYYSGRIPSEYVLGGYPELCDAAIDLTRTTFCVPVIDQYSPVAYAISMEVHWYHPDVKHTGIESLLRQTECVAHIIGGRDLTKTIKSGCKKCRILHKKSVDSLMGPIQDVNLCIAPCFYACQVDIFGPYKSYSNVNKRASIKVWFLVFCCCTTGAIDVRIMDDYSSDSFIQAFIRFSCRFGYPKVVLPDEGSQLVKGCKDMRYSFTDTKQRLFVEYGVEYVPCPVGAHYVHGKVERKIRQIKKSLHIQMENEKLSVIQWETLMQQISNSINNLPIGVRNRVEAIENLDIITPNRLILGRNNNRCPNAPLEVSRDLKKLIQTNADIFKAWFKAWLTSYVPTLVERPKWHRSDANVGIGDVILFLKSEQEYDLQYQYGIVSSVSESKDGHVRRVEIEYRNHNENITRKTQRGVRDIVMIHPIDDLDIYHELAEMVVEDKL